MSQGIVGVNVKDYLTLFGYNRRRVLRLYLLGKARATIKAEPLHLDTRKAFALLAYLAMQEGEQQRDALAALLWPEQDQTKALASLRQACYSLRRFIPDDVLQGDRQALWVGKDMLWAYAIEFDALASTAWGDLVGDAPALRREPAGEAVEYSDLGMILTSGGLGALLAAAIVGQQGVPRRFITFMYTTWALATLAVAGYGLAQATWQLAIVCAVVNGLEAAGMVAWATAKHRRVPRELLGRVSSVDWFVSSALVPASYALTAPVVAVFGVRATLIGAAVIGSVVTAAALLLPGMRAVEEEEDDADAASGMSRQPEPV
jgi:hypothetical protein